MRLTITNLHPKVIIGGTDRRGWYTEVYLSFAEFRVRITRAKYGPHHQDLWADIGPVFEPSTFFRMDYVMTALRRMEEPGSCAEASESPTTLAEMDVIIWAAHAKLAEHLSGVRYREIRSTIQQVMREGSAMARPEQPLESESA